ncbi:hypothetical protein G3T16_15140 [Kineobactrum salinum]|uniref:Uncharacterized protein n=1 Tax=Kineobactrum salinum TaxID=2708301 RepID=A0A6C0U2Y8_9GAMM|nr:hypothetical protein G3T16_15140 [Kineobactrum salinum]
MVYIGKVRTSYFLKHAQLKTAKPDKRMGLKLDLIKPFWKQKTETIRSRLVHPLIVYADLVATGHPRNLDPAKRLREKHLR